MDKLSDEMNEDEMNMLARVLHKIKCYGHCEVTILVQNHHLRFIKETTSFELPSTNVIKEIAK